MSFCFVLGSLKRVSFLIFDSSLYGFTVVQTLHLDLIKKYGKKKVCVYAMTMFRYYCLLRCLISNRTGYKETFNDARFSLCNPNGLFDVIKPV